MPGTEGQRRPDILHEGITYTFTEHVYTRRQQTRVDRGTRTRTFHVAPPIPLLVGNARYEGDTERGGFDARSKTVVGAALQSGDTMEDGANNCHVMIFKPGTGNVTMERIQRFCTEAAQAYWATDPGKSQAPATRDIAK